MKNYTVPPFLFWLMVVNTVIVTINGWLWIITQLLPNLL